MYDFFFILKNLMLPTAIVGVAVFLISRYRRKRAYSGGRNRYLLLTLSKEDAASQLFLLLSVLFFGVTLLSFSNDLGGPISWRTVILLTSLAAIVCAYYLKVIFSLIAGLVAIPIWWAAQAAEWSDLPDRHDIRLTAIFAGLMFIVLIYYVVGRIHEKEERFKRFSVVYTIIGIVSVTGILFFFSTKPGLQLFQEGSRGLAFFESWKMAVCLLFFALSLISVVVFSAQRRLVSGYETFAVILLAALFGVIVLLPRQDLFLELRGHSGEMFSNRELSSAGVLWAIVFNSVVFFELLGLISAGYTRQEEWLINLGALFLFFLIILKYFDWMFTFLDKSVFFIGAGILLFAVGWSMEKGRRYMLASMKVDSQRMI